MLPSESVRQALEARGLILRNRFGSVAIIKPIEIEGNSLPYYLTSHMEDLQGQGGIDSDCPMIEWSSREDQICLSHWAYVPGPGPGDFDSLFESEGKAIEFIVSYFFGDNLYFSSKATDQMHRRDSYNLEEVSDIINEVLRMSREKFGDREFSWERGTYYRLPVERFWMERAEPEFPEMIGETGFMGYTMMMLRRKVNTGRRLTAKDVSTVADIFRHLSLEMMKAEADPSKGE